MLVYFDSLFRRLLVSQLSPSESYVSKGRVFFSYPSSRSDRTPPHLAAERFLLMEHHEIRANEQKSSRTDNGSSHYDNYLSVSGSGLVSRLGELMETAIHYDVDVPARLTQNLGSWVG